MTHEKPSKKEAMERLCDEYYHEQCNVYGEVNSRHMDSIDVAWQKGWIACEKVMSAKLAIAVEALVWVPCPVFDKHKHILKGHGCKRCEALSKIKGGA